MTRLRYRLCAADAALLVRRLRAVGYTVQTLPVAAPGVDPTVRLDVQVSWVKHVNDIVRTVAPGAKLLP